MIDKVLNAKDLVAFVKKAASEKWGYVYGGDGEKYDEETAEKWAKSRKKPSSHIGTARSYFVTRCKKWFGKRVVDCSGLIIAAFRSVKANYSDQTANTFYDRCGESGKIKDMSNIPGLCVHKSGHIGIYVGDGLVVESRGTDYGVVLTKLEKRPWTGWGKLADVAYPETPVQKPTLRRGSKGEAVENLQETLNKKMGSALKIDGKFGPKTQKAVKTFQKKYKLKVDGIAGPQTNGKLFG